MGSAKKLPDPMSALGHEQTSRHVRVMSVIPLKADIHQRGLHVRFVPGTDRVQPEPIDFHWGVMLIDVGKKQPSSAPLDQDPSTDAIDSVAVADDAILLHGLGKKDTNRTWSAVISLKTGNLSAGVSTPTSSLALTGECTAKL